MIVRPDTAGTVPATLSCPRRGSDLDIVDLLPVHLLSGIGTALLSGVVDWARAGGFERVPVDFETANLLARRFWSSSFTAVCLSFERHLDDRLVGRAPEPDR